MPRKARVDQVAIDMVASRQIISVRELSLLGMPSRTIANRVSRRGPWRRLLPGVVMLNNGTPTWFQQLEAALRYSGSEALITGNAGCHLHGLVRLPRIDSIHVLIPESQHRTGQGNIVVERTKRMPPTVKLSGLRVAPVDRCILDCARRMSDLDAIRALVGEGVQRGQVSTAALHHELNAGSCRGSALPRTVLQEVSDGVRSAAEGWAKVLVAKTHLPEPQWNVPIYDASGQFIAIPDAWFDEVALAWEIDSYEFHLSPEDYRRTLERRTAMNTLGVEVLHTLPGRIRTEPEAVRAELQAMYAVAADRRRPDIRTRP